MDGPILSDSTPFHDQSVGYKSNSTPSSVYYHPVHPSHSHSHPPHLLTSSSASYSHHHHHHHHQQHQHLRRPLSPSSNPMSLSSASHPPPPDSTFHHHHPSNGQPNSVQLNRKPTLPGIASILAFAAHHPSSGQLLSSSARPRALCPPHQSSDPVVHALPLTVPASASRCVGSSSPSSQHTSLLAKSLTATLEGAHDRRRLTRRRSSSTTVVDCDPHFVPPPPSTTAANDRPTEFSYHLPPLPIHYLSPSDHRHPIPPPPSQGVPSPSNLSSLRSVHSLCHPATSSNGSSDPADCPPSVSGLSSASASQRHHDFTSATTTHTIPTATTASAATTTTSAALSLSHSTPSNPMLVNQSLLLAREPLQRRHSDRISRSKPRHHRGYHGIVTNESNPSPQPHHRACLALPQQHHGLLNAEHHPDAQAWSAPSAVGSGAGEIVSRHMRRLSNASTSSSSSVSASISLSSEFGTSLSLGSHAHLNSAGPQPSSLSTSVNSTRSACIDQRVWQRLEMRRSCSLETKDKGGPHETAQSMISTSLPLSAEQQQQPARHNLGPVIVPSATTGASQHRYQCSEPGCGKTFSRPSSLKIHSYSHTGQKPFKCLRCDRAFSVQSNLKRHQKVHQRRATGNPSGVLSRPTPPHNMTSYDTSARGESAARGRAIEEESAEEEDGSEVGIEDRMEE